MDHAYSNGRSYYQLDPQVTGDQLSSHPSHDLHNAAYPDSDYQPGMGYAPPPQGPPPSLSSSSHNVGQDSKAYPPVPEPLHELDSIHNAAYPDSNYRPRAAYSPSSSRQPQALASTSIHNAAYPGSDYRPGAAYSATSPRGPPRGPPPGRPLPSPRHLDSASRSSQPPWVNRGGEASCAAVAGPPALTPQATGSELPPPPYQPGGGSNGSNPPGPLQVQPPSPSYSHRNNPYDGYQTSYTSSPTHQHQEDAIPMTSYPVYQNAIGHVANSSNASSALERTYKEYDRDQAVVDDNNRRSNRCKWLLGSIITTVLVAVIVGIVVALIKKHGTRIDDDDN